MRRKRPSHEDGLFCFHPGSELIAEIFVNIFPVCFEIFEVCKFFKTIRCPIPLHPYQRYRSAADQYPFCALEYIIERWDIPDHLPFFNFSDIYDIIVHTK
jgi:hypothetical protein